MTWKKRINLLTTFAIILMFWLAAYSCLGENAKGQASNPSDKVSVYFDGKDIQVLCTKIHEWTGKSVVQKPFLSKHRLSIFGPKHIPKAEAVAHVVVALEAFGYKVEEKGSFFVVRPPVEEVPDVTKYKPLAGIDVSDRTQMARRTLSKRNCSATVPHRIISPLAEEFGHISEVDTENLLVIDAIANLTRIEKKIDSLTEAELKKQDRRDQPPQGDSTSKDPKQLPTVIKLKHADPEYMAEKLNTLFSEPGTISTIRLEDREMVNHSMDVKSKQPDAAGKKVSNDIYQPWWANKDSKPWGSSKDPNAPPEKKHINEMIGRIRFIPYMRKKSILVLAPRGELDAIREAINELDQPSPQLMIKVIVLSIEHRDLSSIGLRLADEAFLSHGKVSDSEIVAFSQLRFLQERDSFTLDATTDIAALVDLLVKQVNARVLNEQALWTKNHEAAHFFKGEVVGFLTQSTVTGTGLAQGTTEFLDVGMMVMIRPNITQELNGQFIVDMDVLVELQNTTDTIVNTQPVRNKMKTATKMTVKDGQTLMLGGILFQKDSIVTRKFPLLGDIPVVGPLLFRHQEDALVNEELIVFITPHVIGPGVELNNEAKKIQDSQIETYNREKAHFDKYPGNMEKRIPQRKGS